MIPGIVPGSRLGAQSAADLHHVGGDFAPERVVLAAILGPQRRQVGVAAEIEAQAHVSSPRPESRPIEVGCLPAAVDVQDSRGLAVELLGPPKIPEDPGPLALEHLSGEVEHLQMDVRFVPLAHDLDLQRQRSRIEPGPKGVDRLDLAGARALGRHVAGKRRRCRREACNHGKQARGMRKACKATRRLEVHGADGYHGWVNDECGPCPAGRGWAIPPGIMS